MKKCVFSGTFDPPTTGHESIVKRCLEIFDEVVVAVMINMQKKPYLSAETRKALLEELFKDESRVRVIIYNKTAADLLEEENTRFYVRGIRDGLDLDYENRNARATEKLKKDVITIYLPAEQDKTHISSSLVRSSAAFEKEYAEYIPEKIRKQYFEAIRSKDV